MSKYQRKPPFDEGEVVFRKARKPHRCHGGHDGQKRRRCDESIRAGDHYVEYLGESPLYESGKRYHFQCAKEQGLVTETITTKEREG